MARPWACLVASGDRPNATSTGYRQSPSYLELQPYCISGSVALALLSTARPSIWERLAVDHGKMVHASNRVPAIFLALVVAASGSWQSTNRGRSNRLLFYRRQPWPPRLNHASVDPFSPAA